MLIPYLNFDGNAEEAMTYYLEVLQGENNGIMRYSDNPDAPAPEYYKDKILHATIKLGEAYIYLSDTFPGQMVKKGDQVSINIGFDSLEAIDRVYQAMKDESTVTMELQDTFWNARFAALVDKYGVSWSFNYQYPDKK